MANLIKGHCQCQQTQLELSFPHPLKCYAPRACDCDFCTSRDIRWLSDPKGTLVINTPSAPEILRQGSEQAEFIACSECLDVVSVRLPYDGGYLGAVNTQMLNTKDECKSAQAASPQKLSAEDKVRRWTKIWMPVNLEQ